MVGLAVNQDWFEVFVKIVDIKKGTCRDKIPFIFLIRSPKKNYSAPLVTVIFFSDTSLLTSKLTQVIQLSATNLYHACSPSIESIVGDSIGKIRSTPHSTRHLANCKTLLVTMTRDLDNNTTIELDTSLVPSTIL